MSASSSRAVHRGRGAGREGASHDRPPLQPVRGMGAEDAPPHRRDDRRPQDSYHAAWRRADARVVLGHACAAFDTGEPVEVVLEPEGPQLSSLAPDLADALAARPEALDFFLSLATFYRKGYLRWVDATKRRPDVRAARIAELVELLAAGCKERPRTG